MELQEIVYKDKACGKSVHGLVIDLMVKENGLAISNR